MNKVIIFTVLVVILAVVAEDLVCSGNEAFSLCGDCDKTCSQPNQTCVLCRIGCLCMESYVRAPNGSCIHLQDCP